MDESKIKRLDEIDEFIMTIHNEIVEKDNMQNEKMSEIMNDPEWKIYLARYYDCLEKKYYNPSFGSLNNLLHIIVNDLENAHQYFDQKSKVKAIHDLIDLFTRIINDKRDDQLYGAYELISDLCTNGSIVDRLDKSEVVSYLKVFFYPIETYVEKNLHYHKFINSIIGIYVIYKNYGFNAFDQRKFNILDPRLIRILDMYRDYHYHAGIMKCCDNMTHNVNFCIYMRIVVAEFYIAKYDISLFPKVLDFVYNNVEHLETFCKFNNFYNIETKGVYMDSIMRLIIDACTKNIPVIK